MNFRPRTKLLAACVGAALAQWGSGTALADSAVGVDTAIGNALNPPGRSSMPRPIADDAFDTVRRSPSGQLYGLPPAPPEEFRKTDSGWEFIGGIEFGVLGGAGKQNAKYREYKDFKSGAYLDYFELEGEKPDTAHFLQAFGGGLGHEDQFIGLQFGRYNDWKLRSFYNETPHVFSTTFKPIYRNTGTSKPALDNGTPGGNGATTAAALLAYSKTLPDTEVGLVRKKGGTRLDLTLTDKWKTYASITSEKRTGERPFGLQDSGPNPATAVEGIEPIDYETTDLAAGVGYTDRLTAFNLRASASLFTNNIDYFFPRRARVVADPAPTIINGAANTTVGIDYASYTLAPDNEAYNVKGEYSRKLPDFFKGRFSAAVAWGSSRQDDKIRTPLEPNSPNFSSAGIVQAAANGVAWDPNNWNGVNGSPTSRATAGQRIDSTLYNLSLLLHPLDELGVKGTFRHYETDNKSGTYYAYNPLTGQWGYGIQEGAFNTVAPLAIGGVGCQPAPGRPIVPGCTGAAYAAAAFANSRAMYMPPRDYKQTNYTVSADYDLGDASSLEATLERENFSHTFRERDKTWEDKIKLTYADRSLGDATLRASYEQDRKRGSFYDPLVNSRGGLNWFAIYGIPYSRATLQDIIANSGAVINGVTNPLAGTLTAAGVVTAGSVLNWLTLAGNFNSGGMMKTDQADRDQSIANVRLNYMARPDLDIGTMVQARRVRYPTNTLAAQKDNLTSVNFDVNYQPALGTLISAYYSRQDGRQRQRENFSSNVQARTYAYRMCGGDGVNPLALTVDNIDCFLNNQRDPGLDMMMNTKSTTDVFGFNVAHHFGPIGVSASYTYTESLTRISQIYGLTALTLAQQAIVNSYGAWPDMTMKQHSLELNLILPIDKKTAARFVYHYDKLKLRDWHYDYRALNTTTTFIPADYGPQNYTADMFGVFLQMKL